MHETLNTVVEWINRAGTVHWSFAAPMFVQTVMLVSVLCLLEFFLRNRVRAVVRYWLWALVAVKLLLPVTLSSPASIAYWVIPSARTEAIVDAPTAAPPRAVFRATDINNSEETPTQERELIATGSQPRSVSIDSDTPPTGAAAAWPEPPTSAQASPPQIASPSAAGWLFIAWLGGVLTFSVMVIRRAMAVARLTQAASAASPELQGQLDLACASLRLSSRRIRVKISDEVGCPAICGIWRPTILIPRRLLERLDDKQFRLVFLHELAHWQRWDLHVNLLQTLLQIAYFYNPAVWIANAVSRRLREEAVDDAVLVAAAGGTAGYGQLLLDIAEQLRRPAELSLRLIGILESRHALIGRIRRIANNPTPRTARLGFLGVSAIILTGLVLLPMGAGPSTRAAEPAKVVVVEHSSETVKDEPHKDSPDGAPVGESSAKTVDVIQPVAGEAVVLSGTITDEEGQPVSDASLLVTSVDGGRVFPARVDGEGKYSVKRVLNAGNYDVRIYSNRCIGLIDSRVTPIVPLDPERPTVRDFTLKLACQVRIQAIDEQGKPIPNVHVVPPGNHRNGHNGYTTDADGWVTIGGLPPSSSEYQFGTLSKDFAMAQISQVLNDRKVVVERKIILSRGIAVRGTVTCADGKPASGWRICAQPAWWNYNSVPSGEPIADDGAFVLPHIGPGPHRLNVSIPTGQGSSRAPVVVNSIDLAKHEGPLKIKTDFPSPAGMVQIEGEIKFVGGEPKRSFWIHANSDGSKPGGSQPWHPGESKFRLGPLPPGRYRISFDSQEIEPKVLPAVVAPAKDLKVELKVRGQLSLHGSVVQEDGEPVKVFRVRMVKKQTLRGPNFVGNREWQDVNDPQGRFLIEIPGPGIYAVEATAAGLAIVRSDDVNTDTEPGKAFLLKLSRGKTLSGTVVDDAGNPIDGAVVVSQAIEGGPLPVSTASLRPGAGVKTIAGKFEIAGLNPGKDTLHVLHPDYLVATLNEVEIKSDVEPAPLKIVLEQGRRVQGHVYDNDGRPAPGVILQFQGDEGYGYPNDERAQIFAKVTTDENGRYEVARLPRQLIYVHREREWEALGVIRQTMLPIDGKTCTVDFGGATKTTGQLLVNGMPLADKKLMLSGDHPDFSIVKAQATTDAEGRFTFRGIPAGEHMLYFPDPDRPNEWCRIKTLRFGIADNDLGTINHVAGTLIVRWPEAKREAGVNREEQEPALIGLQYYDPHWFGLQHIGNGPRRQPIDADVHFANLASGKYALSASRPGQAGFRLVVDFKADQGQQTVILDTPQGTATIRGLVDDAALLLPNYRYLEIRSADHRRFISGKIKVDGAFEFSGLPKGDYFLTQQMVLNPDRLAQFSLDDGETKTLAITNAMLPAKPQRGSLLVQVFTSEGLLMEGCDVNLTGADGAVSRHGSQRGQITFVAAPGQYRLSVGYPGFKTVEQPVEIKLLPPGEPYRRRETNITLLRSNE